MNSIKTGFVVVVMLGILYGVYKVLNMPEPRLTPTEEAMLKEAEQMDISFGQPTDPQEFLSSAPGGGGSPFDYAGAPPLNNSTPQAAMPTGDNAWNKEPLPGGNVGTPAPPFGDASLANNTTRQGVAPAAPTGPAQDPTFDAVASVERDITPEVLNPSSAYAPKSENLPRGSVDNQFLGQQTKTPPTVDNSFYAAPPMNDTPGGESPVDHNRSLAESKAGPSTSTAFESAMSRAKQMVSQEDFRGALETLTIYYAAPGLTPEQHEQLNGWLDALAGKVIYSREHLLEQPYVVQRGDTLGQIAGIYRISPQLLHNINRSAINNPNVLIPGTNLKVVRGPFEATVNLDNSTLTLMVDGLYAGRFPVTTGNDPSPLPGRYYVKDIAPGREFTQLNRPPVAPNHPSNPYGSWWIDLGSEMSIHGTAANGSTGGCISLSPVDIADLSSILSRESLVKIDRH